MRNGNRWGDLPSPVRRCDCTVERYRCPTCWCDMACEVSRKEGQYQRRIRFVQRLFRRLVDSFRLAKTRLAGVHASAIDTSRCQIPTFRAAIGRHSQLHEQQTEERHHCGDKSGSTAHLHGAIISLFGAPFKSTGLPACLSRSALVITETELRLIAKAATMGDNSMPFTGYNKPAASGIPSAL